MNLFSSVSEIKVLYSLKQKQSELHHVKSSVDSHEVLRNIWSTNIDYKEEFMILLLNRANKVIGYNHISSGGASACIVDPRQIFQSAILANASSIVLSHNHPSGNTKPSQIDIDITNKIKNGAAFFDINVIDHLIITSEGYFSFADEGIM